MKVKDLIEQLKQYDPELDVWLGTDHDLTPAESIKVEEIKSNLTVTILGKV